MKKAIEGKFYLEAITIQESIITDRLLNFVIRYKIKNISEEELHKPIAFLNKLIGHCKPFFEDENFYNELNEFRFSRNNCVHAMVKSYPGNPTQKISEFQKLAKATSLSGKTLTRKVDAWHTRMKKKHNF